MNVMFIYYFLYIRSIFYDCYEIDAKMFSRKPFPFPGNKNIFFRKFINVIDTNYETKDRDFFLANNSKLKYSRRAFQPGNICVLFIRKLHINIQNVLLFNLIRLLCIYLFLLFFCFISSSKHRDRNFVLDMEASLNKLVDENIAQCLMMVSTHLDIAIR